MSNAPESGDLSEDVVPSLTEVPVIIRKFVPAPWHKPRKQFIRKKQWVHEIVEILIKRSVDAGNNVLKVLGLPSSDYLDLLSMRETCEEFHRKIQYLGFDAGHSQQKGSAGLVSLYDEIQVRRMIDTSSFVHPSSSLVLDRFEQIRLENSMSRNALEQFADFDVINLDICGCIIGANEESATAMLEAIAELLRWQSVRRIRPWLLFITTFASVNEINLVACRPLVEAIRANAQDSEEFKEELKRRCGLTSDELVGIFANREAVTIEAERFLRIFALGMGKWLAGRLKLPEPPSDVVMLPSYCFRHEGVSEPQLLSLAYMIEPIPSSGPSGISVVSAQTIDRSKTYRMSAKRLLTRSFEKVHDLDSIMTTSDKDRSDMASQTEDLLVQCGYDSGEVQIFVNQHR